MRGNSLLLHWKRCQLYTLLQRNEITHFADIGRGARTGNVVPEYNRPRPIDTGTCMPAAVPVDVVDLRIDSIPKPATTNVHAMTFCSLYFCRMVTEIPQICEEKSVFGLHTPCRRKRGCCLRLRMVQSRMKPGTGRYLL